MQKYFPCYSKKYVLRNNKYQFKIFTANKQVLLSSNILQLNIISFLLLQLFCYKKLNKKFKNEILYISYFIIILQ